MHVRSATGESDGSGTGNLIVGWDDPFVTVQRGGENNLVCGDANNFASYGGFVTGEANTVSALYATVGGCLNIASGEAAAVSGGYKNAASINEATVSGGDTVSDSNFHGWAAGTLHSP